jgi:hypothetical protein
LNPCNEPYSHPMRCMRKEIAKVTVIVSDFFAFVFRDTQENESQEYNVFGREFWR